VHLVQLLLPLRDNAGEAFARADFDRVQSELTARFGGVTAYLRSPASGAWVEEGRVDRDQVIMIEVMCERLESAWWGEYRTVLESRFRQDTVLIRAIPVEVL